MKRKNRPAGRRERKSLYSQQSQSAAVSAVETLEGRTLMAAHPLLESGRWTMPLAGPGGGMTSPNHTGSGDSDDMIKGVRRQSLNFSWFDKIGYSMDADIIKFDVSAGQRVQFDVDLPSGGTFDPHLRLFDGVGNELAANDDAAGPGETLGTESFIDYTFNSANTYFIAVSGSGNDAYNAASGFGDKAGSFGSYTIRGRRVSASAPVVTPVPTTPVPATTGDVDDTIAEAIGLGLNTRSTNAISGTNDVDVYRVSVGAGQTISFDVDNLDGDAGMNTYLRLFTGTGAALAANDDGSSPSETPTGTGQSYLRHTFTTAGTYYVAVSGQGNQAYDPVTGLGDVVGATGQYSLRTRIR